MLRPIGLSQSRLVIRGFHTSYLHDNISRANCYHSIVWPVKNKNAFLSRYFVSSTATRNSSVHRSNQSNEPNQEHQSEKQYHPSNPDYHSSHRESTPTIAQPYRKTKIAAKIAVIAIIAASVQLYFTFPSSISPLQLPSNQIPTFKLPILNTRKTFEQLYDDNCVCSRRNIQAGRWWVLLTSTFAHANISHFILNVMSLFKIYPAIISLLTFPGFLALWIVAGIGSHIPAIYWISIKRQLPVFMREPVEKFFWLREDRGSVGASGVICALYAVLGPSQGLASAAAFDLGCLVTGTLPEVDHTVHLAGMGIGILSWALFFGPFKVL